MELAEQCAAAVVVEALDIEVEPYLAATQCAHTVALEGDALHVETCEEISACSASLQSHFGKVLVEHNAAKLGVRFQLNLDDFRLTVGIRAEVCHAAARGTVGDVVFLVAGNPCDIEAFHVDGAVLAIAIADVVDGALVVFLEDGNVDDLCLTFFGFRTFGLADKHLFCHAHYLVRSVAVEDDDIVDVRTVFHKFVLLQSGSHEAFGAIDIELFVGLDDLGGFYGVERTDFRKSRILLCVAAADEFEPIDGYTHHVLQVVLDFGQLVLYLLDVFVGFLLVELQDTCHFYFKQAQQVVAVDVAYKVLFIGSQSAVDV